MNSNCFAIYFQQHSSYFCSDIYRTLLVCLACTFSHDCQNLTSYMSNMFATRMQSRPIFKTDSNELGDDAVGDDDATA